MRQAAAIFFLITLTRPEFAHAAGIPFVLDTGRLRQRLATELGRSLGREIKIGNLDVSLFSGGLIGKQFEIADDLAFSNGPFLTAEKVSAQVAVRPLIFQRKLNVIGLDLVNPKIRLIQETSGKWNASSLGQRAAAPTIQAASLPPPKPSGNNKKTEDIPPNLAIKQVRVSGGRLEFERDGGKSSLTNVNLVLDDFGISRAFPFTLLASVDGGGSVAATGVVGPLVDRDRARVPFQARAKVSELNLLNSQAVSKETNLQGIVSFDGTALGSGASLKLQGTLEDRDFVLAHGGSPVKQNLRFTFQTDYDRDKRAGTLNRGDVQVGGVNASLTGSYELPKGSTLVHIRFHGNAMPLAELMGVFPALNITLPKGSLFEGGAATADLTIDGPLDQARTNGPVKLTNTKLAGFDLGSPMKSLTSWTGIRVGPNTVLESVAAVIYSGPEGTRLEGIQVIAPGIGELTGSGTVSPSHELNFRMQAKIRAAGGLVRVVAGSSPTVIPFAIRGTSERPRFVTDMRGTATGIAAQRSAEMNKAAHDALDRLMRRK